MTVDYIRGFKEFLEGGISEENANRFRSAVSEYYKALTILSSYIIEKNLQKIPKNHTEIFLFLKTSFPEIYEVMNTDLFETYTASYTEERTKTDCEKIKNAIKKVAKLGKVEEEFEEDLKKI